MAEFDYEDLLPIGPDQTEYRLLTTEGVSTVEGPGGRTFLQVEPEALRTLTRGHARHRALPAPRPPGPAAPDHRRPRGHQQRQVRRARPAQERQHRRRRAPADVPGHRHRDRHGQARPARPHRRHRRARHRHGVYDAYTRLNLRYSQMAPITTWEEKNTGSNLPGPDRALRRHRRGPRDHLQVPLHGQGRRQRQQVLPLPGDQGRPEPRAHARLPRREAALARHLRLPALPPGHRHRRHECRVRPEDGEVRLGQVPRRAAHHRSAATGRASATPSSRSRCSS